MDQEESEDYPPRHTGTKTGRRFKTVLAVIGALASVVAIFTGILTIAEKEETYSRAAVANFARLYLALAPSAPDLSLDTLTTENFRSLAQGSESEYVPFWESVETSALESVKVAERKNWYEVRYTITYRNGQVEQVASAWNITCENEVRRYAPFINCVGRELLLDDFEPLD
ncbi:hypothetical protein [Blastococcus goldschmidtiae]|uniref:Uncharacterized protein n=1 Tax=Blastococcus goldschmidtiae TaxID=3075546 RepID=A0ABU2K930_9ACTN|nr:hypothetical protein [Blastococcus sp. DSM 46792]MDT0276705.1 hypothetical protein [Blastococcus sp. DSM 46792]